MTNIAFGCHASTFGCNLLIQPIVENGAIHMNHYNDLCEKSRLA